jgi:hypothetical protein
MTIGGAVFGVGLAALSAAIPVGRWLAPVLHSWGPARWLEETLLNWGWVGSWEGAVCVWIALCLLVFLGVGRMIQMASTNTYVQTLVDDDKRSRVMAFHALAFMGMAPIGSLLTGLIANTALGAPGSLLLAGLACTAGAIAFAGRLPKVHRRPEGPAHPDPPAAGGGEMA